jgi:hypothetical protein
MALKKAAVLRRVDIDGVTYEPSQVIELDDKVLKAYIEDGSLDPALGAVEYCEKGLGAKAIRHAKAGR